ncbi:hypothetical protein QQP08_014112 [Theobroma cacao]|nr:hypothetical protein QQP08_014112 [Theobroma cacao]
MKLCVSKGALIYRFRSSPLVGLNSKTEFSLSRRCPVSTHIGSLYKVSNLFWAGLEHSSEAKYGAGQKECNLNSNHDIHKYAKNPCLKLIHIQYPRGRNGLGHQVILPKTKGASVHILTSNFTSPRDLHKPRRHYLFMVGYSLALRLSTQKLAE